MLEGAGRKQRDEYKLALFLAWHIEAFARQKTLPELQSLLDRQGGGDRQSKKTTMTADDIKAAVRGFTAPPLSEKEKQMLAKRQARAKGKH